MLRGRGSTMLWNVRAESFKANPLPRVLDVDAASFGSSSVWMRERLSSSLNEVRCHMQRGTVFEGSHDGAERYSSKEATMAREMLQAEAKSANQSLDVELA